MSVTKTFVRCVIKVKGNFPEALIWLKQNMDEDVAANIISDHNHSETLINAIINSLAEVNFGIYIMESMFCQETINHIPS